MPWKITPHHEVPPGAGPVYPVPDSADVQWFDVTEPEPEPEQPEPPA